jgi:hypothetical protein
MALLSRIAYEASVRSLDHQERLLAELRARTGVIIGSSTIAVSFLGQPAVEAGGNAWLVIPAVAAFAASVGSGIWVLLPKRELVFSLAGSQVYESLFEFKDEDDEVQRRLAYQLDLFWVENDRKLAELVLWLRIAVVALGIEIALLLTAASGTIF